MPLGERVPFERGRQREVPPLKRRYFAGIDFSSVKNGCRCTDMLLIITSTSHGLFNFINIDDLKLPKEVFSEFLAILAAAHVSKANCDEMP